MKSRRSFIKQSALGALALSSVPVFGLVVKDKMREPKIIYWEDLGSLSIDVGSNRGIIKKVTFKDGTEYKLRPEDRVYAADNVIANRKHLNGPRPIVITTEFN